MSVYSASKTLGATVANDAREAVVVKFPDGNRKVVIANITAQAAFVGTFKIQGSSGDGVWDDLAVVNMQAGGAAANPTAAGNYSALCDADHRMARVVFSAYTSGTARVRAHAIDAV